MSHQQPKTTVSPMTTPASATWWAAITERMACTFDSLSTFPDRWREEGVRVCGINVMPESARITQGQRLLDAGRELEAFDIAEGKKQTCLCIPLWGRERGDRCHKLLEQIGVGCAGYHALLTNQETRTRAVHAGYAQGSALTDMATELAADVEVAGSGGAA